MRPVPAVTGPLLWGRAVVLSVVALVTGSFAHVQADGLLPGVGILLVLLGCGTLAVAPFLRRPGSTPRIVSLLVVGQTVVHTALAVTAGHRGDPVSQAVSGAVTTVVPSSGPSSGRSGSYYDVAYSATTTGHGGASGGLSIPAPLLHAIADASAHPMMALAHLCAAALCGWWLAMGERALWRLLEVANRGWSDLVAPTVLRWVVAARVAAFSSSEVRVRALVVVVLEPQARSALRGRSVSRRGPPLAA